MIEQCSECGDAHKNEDLCWSMATPFCMECWSEIEGTTEPDNECLVCDTLTWTNHHGVCVTCENLGFGAHTLPMIS